MLTTTQPIDSSYRDPAGFVFQKDGVFYRQINVCFKQDFELFINSGCYNHLSSSGLLIPHEEVNEKIFADKNWYKTIKPAQLSFISYAYEWSFDMLKDAALLTLQLVAESIKFGCILKDATPFNIQWKDGKPIFIDSLSFERYDSSQPWIAYRQFCECFLSPLLLMHYCKQPLQALQLAYPEGIPLSITQSILPWKSRLSFYSYLHIHLHANIAKKNKGENDTRKIVFSKKKLLQLISSLQSLIHSLHWAGKPTTWENYYKEAAARENYIDNKKRIITQWLTELPSLQSALDIGGNEGTFSALLASQNIETITADFDHSAINNLYIKLKKDGSKKITPLLLDVSNPSPAIGLNNNERPSFIQRTKVDLVFALALIHHLSIGKNIPFIKVAAFFSSLTKYLIIEFVPKDDEKVAYMLASKKDTYPAYSEENFILDFKEYFRIVKNESIEKTNRTLYFMQRND